MTRVYFAWKCPALEECFFNNNNWLHNIHSSHLEIIMFNNHNIKNNDLVARLSWIKAILWTLWSFLCTDQCCQITSVSQFCYFWHFWEKNQLILSGPADLYTPMIIGFIRLVSCDWTKIVNLLLLYNFWMCHVFLLRH